MDTVTLCGFSLCGIFLTKESEAKVVHKKASLLVVKGQSLTLT